MILYKDHNNDIQLCSGIINGRPTLNSYIYTDPQTFNCYMNIIYPWKETVMITVGNFEQNGLGGFFKIKVFVKYFTL